MKTAYLIPLFLLFSLLYAEDFEWNTQGIMDTPAYMFGTSVNWGEYHITVLQNDTGSDIFLSELGFSCSGPGPAQWVIWTDVTGFNPPGNQTKQNTAEISRL